MLSALAVSCRNGGAPIEIENRTFEDEAAYVTTGLDVDLPAAKGAVATAIRAKLAEILYQDICNVSRTGDDPDFEPFAGDAADTQALMDYYGEQLTAALAAASDREYAERIEGRRAFLRGYGREGTVLFGENGVRCLSLNESLRRHRLISEVKVKFNSANGYSSSVKNANPLCDGVRRVRYVNAAADNVNPELFMHIRNCICKWLCIIRQLQS